MVGTRKGPRSGGGTGRGGPSDPPRCDAIWHMAMDCRRSTPGLGHARQPEPVPALGAQEGSESECVSWTEPPFATPVPSERVSVEFDVRLGLAGELHSAQCTLHTVRCTVHGDCELTLDLNLNGRTEERKTEDGRRLAVLCARGRPVREVREVSSAREREAEPGVRAEGSQWAWCTLQGPSSERQLQCTL